MQEFGVYASLLSAAAVRQRCHQIGELAMGGQASWFVINETNFKRCVKLVEKNCLQNYPDMNIPYHSRWRHFEIGEVDLWKHYTANYGGNGANLARTAIDLVFVSVLLDAGAGSKWQFREPITGNTLGRSEGLAAASMELFFNHLAKYDEVKGWMVDANCLEALTRRKLATAFQHDHENRLLGLEGRLSMLHGLATVLWEYGSSENGTSRPSDIIDEILSLSRKSLFRKPSIDATLILEIILKRFSQIWPSGYTHQGLNLGDCGFHSELIVDDDTNGIVPFHKLSQWLTYSLLEPLQWAGIEITNIDGLTGLPEYRNGGLFIDTGSLQPTDSSLFDTKLNLHSEAVVEWRALTVFMLDRLAVDLRKSLKMNIKNLPLASILQGGTWSTGRQLARRIRPDASPPLQLLIDGTIF